MSIKQFRLSAQAKEQLIRLKTQDGHRPLEHPLPLGVLPVAAAALAAGAHRDPGRQQRRDDLAGLRRRAHELYLALLKERCEQDGLGTSDDVLLRQFRLHLHRGIGYLAAPQAIRSIGDLVQLALEDEAAQPAE